MPDQNDEKDLIAQREEITRDLEELLTKHKSGENPIKAIFISYINENGKTSGNLINVLSDDVVELVGEVEVEVSALKTKVVRMRRRPDIAELMADLGAVPLGPFPLGGDDETPCDCPACKPQTH